MEQLYDGQESFVGGQDASKIPDRVPENAFYAGINITTQNDALGPRWGLIRSKLNFPDGSVIQKNLGTRTYETVFRLGKVQGWGRYSIGIDYYNIFIISGIIFLVNVRTKDVLVLDIEDGSKLDETADRIFTSPAGKYFVIHDYPAYPVIIEGFSARRADPANYEIPISVMGTYNQNRYFINNAGNEFTGGDPAGSNATPDAPITFLEVFFPSSPYVNQFFQLSTNYNNDPITAMTFLQVVDTSTGIGPLMISTPRAIYSYATQNPRNQWQAGQFGSVFVANAGIAGSSSFTAVNTDLMFVSSDGQIRSMSMSRTEQGKWAKVPISREIQNWLIYRDKSLVQFAVMAYFKNKVLVSVNPYRVTARTQDGNKITDFAFGGIAVLELDNISGIGVDAKPVWAGLWTGVRPTCFIENDDKLFTLSKDDNGVNHMYEFNPNSSVDVDEETGKERYIQSTIYTREYSFKSPFSLKEAAGLDISVNEVEGDLDLKVSFKPSQGATFALWKEFKYEAPYRTCGVIEDEELKGFAPHQFRNIPLGSPEGGMTCDLNSGLAYGVFKKLQLKIEISGRDWELHEFLIRANPLPESHIETVCDYDFKSQVKLFKECDTNWIVRPFETCQPVQT